MAIKDIKVTETFAKVAKGLAKPAKNVSWDDFKNKSIQFVGGLIMERNRGRWVVSIGRVSWWMALLPAIYVWVSSGGLLDAGSPIKDISPNHLNVILALAAYNFSKKITDTVSDVWGKSGGASTADSEPINKNEPG